MTHTDYMAAAGEIALIAGRMIRDRMDGAFSVATKSEKHDHVTEIDIASEKLVRDELRRRFPGHRFFGEEEASADLDKAREVLAGYGPDEYVWFVDPLDGTTNFVLHLPLFCVSIALAKGGEIIAAAVMDPTRDALFTAARGEGAFLNGQPIHVSDTADFADAVISTSLPTAKHSGRDDALRTIRAIFPKISSSRLLHCAALSIANVAAGRTDGHWEFGLNVWDMAAGALLVTEAGGKVSAMDGGPFTIFSRDILCSNGSLQDRLTLECGDALGAPPRARMETAL